MTNLNALIEQVGTLTRHPDEARNAVLHVLWRVETGQLTAEQGRECLEMLGLTMSEGNGS